MNGPITFRAALAAPWHEFRKMRWYGQLAVPLAILGALMFIGADLGGTGDETVSVMFSAISTAS